MTKLFHKSSPLRIFAFSTVSSVLILLGVLAGVGPEALLLTLILAVIEITFSFDNAIINAKILSKLARPWQTLFLTLGVIVAIFGMRILFPIIIVAVTAHLGWREVIDLALHHPHEYAYHLEQAHASIAAFGGAFLLMLAFNFFFEDERKVHWINRIEKQLRRFSHWSAAPILVLLIILWLSFLPANAHGADTIVAGMLGAATYIFMQAASALFSRLQGKTTSRARQRGLVALSSLLYLEILDASFSFDGVIGAFAVTSDVILIAAGLGIGALWARSLTVYMVRNHMLSKYIYVEHGAHYTVLVLAAVLLASVVWNISNLVPGLAGIGIIGSSVIASIQARRKLAA